MTRKALESLLELILNEADFKDMEVISKALEKRSRDLNSLGSLGMSSSSLSESLSQGVREQMGRSLQGMHQMTRQFVAKMIRDKAPEIPEQDLEALLDEWVPLPQGAGGKPKGPEMARGLVDGEEAMGSDSRPGKSLPPDVHRSMVMDFIEFTEGRMSPTRLTKLHEQIPDWSAKYWDHFPPRTRKLIKLYLDGKIDRAQLYGEIEGGQ